MCGLRRGFKSNVLARMGSLKSGNRGVQEQERSRRDNSHIRCGSEHGVDIVLGEVRELHNVLAQPHEEAKHAVRLVGVEGADYVCEGHGFCRFGRRARDI